MFVKSKYPLRVDKCDKTAPCLLKHTVTFVDHICQVDM